MKEHQHTEWKETWRDEYLRWICGFANAEGGVLDIGRNNRGVMVGVSNAARLLEEIPNKVRDILGSKPPDYDSGMSGLMLTFHASAAYLALINPKTTAPDSGGITEKTPVKTTQKTTQKILEMLQRDPTFSRREIAEALGDITENGVKYHLEKLKAAGRIARHGGDKGGHWEVIP